jgi:chaperonin GroES
MRHPHDFVDVEGTFPIDSVRPIHDYMLVKQLKHEKSMGGLVLVGGERREWIAVQVVRVGSGYVSEKDGEVTPLPYKPGEYALMMDYAGDRIVLRDAQYRLVREQGFWAKITLNDDLSTLDLKSLIPMRDCVLVNPHELKTRGGLFVPEKTQQHLITADVISAGPGFLNVHTHVRFDNEVESGEQVVMLKYAGANVKINGVECRLIQKADIKCRVPVEVRVG